MTSFKTLFFIISSLITMACYANENTWYHVEVLVFETKDKRAHAEDWPLDPGKPLMNDAVNLTSEPGKEFAQLLETQLSLKQVKKKIQNNYRLVLHKGWRQKINDKDHAIKVRLQGGKMLDLAGLDDNAGSYFEVDGTVKLSRGTYLFVENDLLLRKPNSSTSSVQAFRLKETNRLRLEEIHYLDHPLYGVIIKVSHEKKA